MTAAVDTLVSLDFLPSNGGAHGWMYQVYSRWPGPVRALSEVPSTDAAERAAQRVFDAQPHGSLELQRVLLPAGDISLLRPGFLGTVRQHLAALPAPGRPGRHTLHVLRAFPEGIAPALHRVRHPLSCRLVTYAHGEEILVARSSRQLHAIAKAVYRLSDLVIANSENTARLVREEAPKARVQVIHPGVDNALAGSGRPDDLEYRHAQGFADSDLLLATVARMESRKNQETVIRAVAQLRREGVAVSYLCAGDGPERARLERLAHAEGVERFLRFPGAVSDAEKWRVFAACDLHVMPSIQAGSMIEGFGMVFLEAAAAGKPSICGRTGGQLEAVGDGITGLAVDGTSVAELAQAIRRLAHDPALRSSMGAAALERAAAHDWSHVAARTADLARGLWES